MPRHDFNYSTYRPAFLVDEIGRLKAQLAEPLARLKAAEDALKALGAGRYLGMHYEGNVFIQSRDKLDMDAVRAKLSKQFLFAHTTTTDVKVLKVTARQLGDDSLRQEAA